ncbi:uncharacterized protein LOC131816330 isoform X4 [Mustela lutreola]|uniref:uncharacterized protein LOC131816330 isoform X4 n=1 Tax=Mustela lutreola TaxID=9666 RepID=UPI0027971803|nr:uncharacterized protein LOC131816330 isoform X4 [Mustela lutreola]
MGTFEGPSGSTLRTAWPLLPLRCGMMAQDFWKLQKLLFLNGGPKVSCDLVSRAACAPNPGVLFFLFVLPLRLAPPPPATARVPYPRSCSSLAQLLSVTRRMWPESLVMPSTDTALFLWQHVAAESWCSAPASARCPCSWAAAPGH